jgi:hypothetical protein
MRYTMKQLSSGLYQFWKVDFRQVIGPEHIVRHPGIPRRE